MADPVWGLLAKSAEDPTTIDQAIESAIIAHEADPTAHLGPGESLEQHKTNEVIDHPAQSVVADKFSVTNSLINYALGIFNPGALDNCLGIGGAPSMSIYQNSSFSGDGNYYIDTILPYDVGYNGGDIVWNFFITAGNGSGTWTASVKGNFAKLELKYGYYRIGYYTTSWQYSSWIAVQDLYFKKFRFFYNSIDGQLEVYLGANLVFSHVHPIAFEDDELTFNAYINRGNLSNASLQVGGFSYALDGV